jgi:hypothetical protein
MRLKSLQAQKKTLTGENKNKGEFLKQKCIFENSIFFEKNK